MNLVYKLSDNIKNIFQRHNWGLQIAYCVTPTVWNPNY